MFLDKLIPKDWRKLLKNEINTPYFKELDEFLQKEMRTSQIFPEKKYIFSTLDLIPFEKIKVFVVGQDPYHGENQAHGLAFSVKKHIKIPPSLKNIFKELKDDLNIEISKHGYLNSWAEQGVFLLNTVLTVRAHQANSHAKHGWEIFTDALIQKVNEREDPVIFLLWGKPAEAKQKLINIKKHHVIISPHPSPLSAHRGFFGSKPFSKINNILKKQGLKTINWQLPEINNFEDLPLFFNK